MNDCFTIHLHDNADGSVTGRMTTITGRLLADHTGRDRQAVVTHFVDEMRAYLQLVTTASYNSEADQRGCQD